MSDVEDPQPVYVRCDPPVAVDVEQDGRWWPGVALAYRGERVTVRFTVDVGESYQQVVDAVRVRRT